NMSKLLGVDPSDSIEELEAAYFSGEIIAPSEWTAIAKALARGGKTDCEHADRFARLAALSGLELVETYLDIFCRTDTRAPRKSIASKGVGDAALVTRLLTEQQRVCDILQRRRAVASRDRSAALATVAHEVLTRYRAEKERRGLLDY